MLKLVVNLFKTNSFARHALSIVLSVLLGAFLFWFFAGPRVTIVERIGPVQEKIVYVDKPVLVTKDVIKYLPPPSRAEVEKVMMENAFLQNQVASLNDTIATLKSTGSGQIVYVDKPVPGTTQTVREATFKDWRLDFKAEDTKADYTLTQKFEIINVAGKDKQGKPFVTSKLLEIGPGELRTPATNVSATTVISSAESNGKSWFFSAAIQGGFAFTRDTDGKSQPGGVVGVKWLTRGYTKSAEDGIYALVTPVVYLGSNVQEIGLLPISFNVGRIPKQPFRDLWVSPLLTWSTKGTGLSHAGISLVATF